MKPYRQVSSKLTFEYQRLTEQDVLNLNSFHTVLLKDFLLDRLLDQHTFNSHSLLLI